MMKKRMAATTTTTVTATTTRMTRTDASSSLPSTIRQGQRQRSTKNKNNKNTNYMKNSNVVWFLVSIVGFGCSYYFMMYVRQKLLLITTRASTTTSSSSTTTTKLVERSSSSRHHHHPNDSRGHDATATAIATNPNNVRILVTNLGWNHPNLSLRNHYGRTIYTKELYLEGIQKHDWYVNDTTAWLYDDDDKGNDEDDVFTYIFLDVETCYEQIYPNYGGGVTSNSDIDGGRVPISSSGGIRKILNTHTCPNYIQFVLNNSPLLLLKRNKKNGTYYNGQLVLLDCGYFGPTEPCMNRKTSTLFDMHDERVALVSLSATQGQHNPMLDIGLPPPPITKSYLNQQQESSILTANCDDVVDDDDDDGNNKKSKDDRRPYLVSFMGNFRHPVRQILRTLHNNDTIIIQPASQYKHDEDSLFIISNNNNKSNSSSSVLQTSYKTVLQQSQFGLVPRGDYLYTYRLLEVMSAGAIPILLADDWVVPFHTNVVNWTDIALIIPQKEAQNVINYINAISRKQRCIMRQNGYHMYQKYLSTPSGIVNGIIESLEYLRHAKEKPGNEETKKTK